VLLPDAGTSSFRLFYGNDGAATASSSADAVLAEGLWWTGWGSDGTIADAAGTMESTFAGLDYGDAVASGSVANVACADKCNPQGVDDQYRTLYEGWFVAPAATLPFGIDVEETGEIWFGGLRFKDGFDDAVAVSLAAYGTQGGSGSFEDDAAFAFPSAGHYRFNARHEEDSSGTEKITLYDQQTDTGAQPIPTTSFRYAPRDRVYTTAVGAEEFNGEDLRLGPEVSVGRYAGGVRAWLGGEELLFATAETGYLHVVLRFDGIDSAARLFVSGEERVSKVISTFNVTASAPLLIGDVVSRSHSDASDIDELRFSTTARSDDWIRMSHDVVAGGAVTVTP
jgi:hypothetical protein